LIGVMIDAKKRKEKSEDEFWEDSIDFDFGPAD
jgi:hypothetical protein